MRLLPSGTITEKWESAGGIIIWLPIAMVILSALIIGVDSLRVFKKPLSPFRKIILFTSTVLISAGFQYGIGLIFFMQLVYVLAGATH